MAAQAWYAAVPRSTRHPIMAGMIITAVAVVWDWLPEFTIVLKFCTALVGFVVTVPLLVRRVRRWLRPRARG